MIIDKFSITFTGGFAIWAILCTVLVTGYTVVSLVEKLKESWRKW